MKNVRLCIDYISTSNTKCLNCYFLEEKSNKVVLLYKNIGEDFDFTNLSSEGIAEINKAISDVSSSHDYKVVGKVNFIVTSREVFSFSDVFPKTSMSRIRKYNRRDIEDSFPDFEKKNVYIESSHEDGGTGTIIFTTFCPVEIYDFFTNLCKELHMPMGQVTSSNFALTDRYEESYKKEFDSACLIHIEDNFALVNLYINGNIVDNLLVESGNIQINNESTRKYNLQQIKSRVLALIAKHEFGFEKVSISNIKVTSNNSSALSLMLDYLKESTAFDVDGINYYPLASASYQNRYTFNKYRKSFFQKGFTLIEVVVSVSIFSILALGAFSSIASISNVPSRNTRSLAINNVITDISEVFLSHPDTFEETYYLVNDITYTSTETSNTFNYNSSFKLEETTSTYVLTYTLAQVTAEDPRYTTYTLSIESIKETNDESSNFIKEIITMETIK